MYYFYVESIINLEINIAKVGLTSKQVYELDSSVLKGTPYFFAGHENYGSGEDTSTVIAMHDIVSIINSGKVVDDINKTETGQRIMQSQSQIGKKNLLAIRVLNQMIRQKKHKTEFGEELYNIATRVQHVLLEAARHGEKCDKKNPAGFEFDYLKKYQDIRYL